MIITPPVVLSYPALVTPKLGPKPKPGDLAKYSCTLLFPKGSDLTPLKQALMSVLTEKFGDKVKRLLEEKELRLPFRRDEEKIDLEKFDCFINVSSKDRPGLVDRYAGPDGKPAKLTDFDKLYPGAIVKAALSVYAYDTSGNKGASFGLQHIQWWADDDRLDSRKAAQDAFSAEARPDADLGSVSGGVGSKGEALADLLS